MENLFRVGIHYLNDYGYIEYDPNTKKAFVKLADNTKRQEVETYLSTEHVFRVAHKTLLDFEELKTVPTESLENFKLCLTRLWEATDVLVDWSRPILSENE
ncbi:MAG: hypothetical protein H6Q66_2758 [Firmicutes bacterium]|nr:hypothetical protein [Bacillota bacterium]